MAKVYTGLPEEEWKQKRKSFLTGTDVACLFGLHKYKSLREVVQDKFGEASFFEPNEYMTQGQNWEPIILYETASSLHTVDIRHHEFWVDEEHHLAATIDAMLKGKLLGEQEDILCEAKCTNISYLDLWLDCPPINYLLQIQAQLLLTQSPYAYLAVMFFDDWPRNPSVAEFVLYKIKPNQIIQEKILDKTEKFWNNKGIGLRTTQIEKEEIIEMLKNDVEIVKSPSEVREISKSQLRIIRQTALEQTIRLLGSFTPVEIIVDNAKFIEKVMENLSKSIGDGSREFYMELSSSVKRAVDLGIDKPEDIEEAVLQFLNYIGE